MMFWMVLCFSPVSQTISSQNFCCNGKLIMQNLLSGLRYFLERRDAGMVCYELWRCCGLRHSGENLGGGAKTFHPVVVHCLKGNVLKNENLCSELLFRTRQRFYFSPQRYDYSSRVLQEVGVRLFLYLNDV